MRVALVYDYLTQFGGGERVLSVLMELFPNAPVYTLLHDKEITRDRIDNTRIRTSFLQNIPLARSRHRFFPILMPVIIEQFNLSKYDLVISASHSFGKGVVTGPNTLHISYCFTPMRYVWDDSHRYVREFTVPGWLRSLIPFPLTYVRLWDVFAADRVDTFVAISKFVAGRINKYYQRDATVIYPPVDCDGFSVVKNINDRFLIVSRLMSYKRIDLAIEAFNKLGLPLDIVGTGPEEDKLKKIALPNIKFHGFLSDKKTRKMFAECRAFVFPQEEDFGLTVLEAAAAGRPVIAFAGGGALETIQEAVTGIFFAEQTVEALCTAVQKASSMEFDSQVIRSHALLFSADRFKVKFMEMINREWANFPRKRNYEEIKR